MKIEIIQQDIDQGSAWCRSGPCPLELALSRAFGRPMRAGRGTFAPAGPDQKTASLPHVAAGWSRSFDWNSNDPRVAKPVPMSFEAVAHPEWI